MNTCSAPPPRSRCSLPAFRAPAATATATRAWQFKPESVAGLAVRNFIGDVRVERGTTPGIHVTATTTIEASSQAEADRLLGLIEFRTADVGRGLALRRPPCRGNISRRSTGEGQQPAGGA